MENCRLCGYEGKHAGKPCPECGADEYNYFSIAIGYVYPEEYEAFKLLVKRVVVIVVMSLGSIVSIFLWLSMQIQNLGQ